MKMKHKFRLLSLAETLLHIWERTRKAKIGKIQQARNYIGLCGCKILFAKSFQLRDSLKYYVMAFSFIYFILDFYAADANFALMKTKGLNCRPSKLHDDVIKWKHFPRYWPFVRGIHRSPHKGQWRGALMFSLISAWINGWVNNRGAGDLGRNRAHYDVIVMIFSLPFSVWHPRHIGVTIPFQICLQSIQINTDNEPVGTKVWFLSHRLNTSIPCHFVCGMSFGRANFEVVAKES